MGRGREVGEIKGKATSNELRRKRRHVTGESVWSGYTRLAGSCKENWGMKLVLRRSRTLSGCGGNLM